MDRPAGYIKPVQELNHGEHDQASIALKAQDALLG